MNEIQPIVREHDGKVTTLSTDFAVFVNQPHYVVLRKIKIVLKRLPHLAHDNFVACSYRDTNGRDRPCYEMDRKAASTLMMQFSGPEATAWHDKYTDAFEAMASAMNDLTTVTFNGGSFLTTEIDGVPHVAMRPVVRSTGLSWGSQHTKLRKNPRWSCTDIETAGSDGRPYRMIALPVGQLPDWFHNINTAKIPDPEIRESILLYQQEDCRALSSSELMSVERGAHRSAVYRRSGLARVRSRCEIRIGPWPAMTSEFR